MAQQQVLDLQSNSGQATSQGEEESQQSYSCRSSLAIDLFVHAGSCSAVASLRTVTRSLVTSTWHDVKATLTSSYVASCVAVRIIARCVVGTTPLQQHNMTHDLGMCPALLLAMFMATEPLTHLYRAAKPPSFLYMSPRAFQGFG